MSKIVLNLIQDIPTPHNNVLIDEFFNHNEVSLKLWYAQSRDFTRYQWRRDISKVVDEDFIYGTKLKIKFILRCLAATDQKFLMVGWMNSNTRLLHLLFFILRRPYNHWTDNPSPNNQNTLKDKFLRWIAYKLLKLSVCKIFCVGKTTVKYFKALGFSDERLVNLPIFVPVEDDISHFLNLRTAIRKRYNVQGGAFLISSGSRLIREKGYDLLIKGVADLHLHIRQHVRLIIVGSGAESDNLKQQVSALGLSDHVQFETWLEFEDFKALIACSDIFVHPARFDSYGGTALGMALGVPVIGSTGSGAAVDRIEHGVNGFLYDPEDTQALGEYISLLIKNPDLRGQIGSKGMETAKSWPPKRGVDIILENLI